LSPDAQHVVHGFGELYLDGHLLDVRGQYPGWLDTATVAYLDPEGYLRHQTGTRLFHVPFNTVALGGGRWVGTNTSEQRTYTSDGLSFPDTYCPAMEPTGRHQAHLTGNALLTHRVVRDGVTLSEGAIDDKLSLAGALVVWSEFQPLQATYGWMPVAGRADGLVVRLQATWQHYEVDPVVVLTPDGPWVVSHDDTRTLVRPWLQTVGYELPNVKTPHAMWDAQAGGLRVVGDAITYVLNVVLDLRAPRVDLAQNPDVPIEPPPIVIEPPPIKPPPIKPPPTEEIDVQPYPDENTTQQQSLARYQAEYVKAGRIKQGDPPPDWGTFKWQSRVIYDYCAGMSYQASEDKHVRELQAELGNPVDPLPPS
jgi:hypothetical protein